MQTRKWLVLFRKKHTPSEMEKGYYVTTKEIIVMAMSHEAAREIARDLLMEEIEFEYNQESVLPIYFIHKSGNDSVLASSIISGHSDYQIIDIKEYK